jgi:glycogenin glucosyltransferase
MIRNPSWQLAAAPDVFPPDNFNAGVLIIRPSLTKFRQILTESKKIEPYDGGDTGLLNGVYPGWFSQDDKETGRLPYTFNSQRILQIFTQKRTMGYWKEVEKKGIKIIHFSSSPKPWSGKLICQADQLWQEYMIESTGMKI